MSGTFIDYTIKMKFKICCFLLLMAITAGWAGAQKRVTLSAAELDNLIGCWQGTLTYSGTIIRKPYSTKADLIVKRIGQTKSFELVHVYSADANDHTNDTLNLSANGRKFEGATILSKRITRKGALVIVTQHEGFDQDNSQQVLIRKIYNICKSKYTYMKKIKIKDQNEWIDREEFSYAKKTCGEP